MYTMHKLKVVIKIKLIAKICRIASWLPMPHFFLFSYKSIKGQYSWKTSAIMHAITLFPVLHAADMYTKRKLRKTTTC